MKKLFMLALLVLMYSPNMMASATTTKTPGQGGNGGGGISRNNRYMTFYSAGFYTEPLDSTLEQIPQLKELLSFFSASTMITEQVKARYLTYLLPSSERKYYRVQANTFTPEVRKRLIEEYVRVMKVDVNEVALFAITDTESQTTYLLPEFYTLKPSEQQAILFHEAYWLISPSSTYAQVVDAEMSFQAFIENPTSTELLLRWVKTIGDHRDTIFAALEIDLKNNSMEGFLKKLKTNSGRPDYGIKIQDILGLEYIECFIKGNSDEYCMPFAKTNAYKLTIQYPNSVFLKVYQDLLNSEYIDFYIHGNFNRRLTSRNLNPFLKNEYLLKISSLRITHGISLYTDGRSDDNGFVGSYNGVSGTYIRFTLHICYYKSCKD